MSTPQKRVYDSSSRKREAQKTKNRILDSAKALFEERGFEKVTIQDIAQKANVSAPSVYAIFLSKRGVLLALMDEAFSPDQFDALVKQVAAEKSPHKRFEITASLCRQLYDAEKAQLSLLRGASTLDPQFKELENEREQRRYDRQKETVESMYKDKAFAESFTLSEIRDILWTFTGRDVYRMFVLERGWSSEAYEKWLAKQLCQSLLKN